MLINCSFVEHFIWNAKDDLISLALDEYLIFQFHYATERERERAGERERERKGDIARV